MREEDRQGSEKAQAIKSFEILLLHHKFSLP
jgi:hypothetical protein